MDEDDMKAEVWLSELVDKHQLELWQAAEQIDASSEWSLSSPCVLVKDGKAVVIPVSGIGNHLTVCSYVEHPLIQKWLQVFEQSDCPTASILNHVQKCVVWLSSYLINFSKLFCN